MTTAKFAAVFSAFFAGHHLGEMRPVADLTKADVMDILSRIDIRGPDECWPWRGSKMTAGYGRIKVRGRAFRAHRLSYALSGAPLAADAHLDHLCHNRDLSCAGGNGCPHRACCNPRHLEPVTPRVNTLRGRGPAAENLRKSHCLKGHEFTSENTQIMKNGGRRCRACAGLTGRGQGWEASKTHCKRGHPFSDDNTERGSKGERTCITCRRQRVRAAYWARKRVAQ